MADITRTITVELTKVFRDAKEGDQDGYGKRADAVIRGIFGDGFDDVKITKIKDIVAQSQPKLTKRERAFCELITDGYIARDSDMEIWWHERKPYKEFGEWVNNEYSIDVECFNEIPFMFITWEDDEPWAVEDLLKLEVEE